MPSLLASRRGKTVAWVTACAGIARAARQACRRIIDQAPPRAHLGHRPANHTTAAFFPLLGTNRIRCSSFSVSARDSREANLGLGKNLLPNQIDGRDRETGIRCTCKTRGRSPLRRAGGGRHFGSAASVEGFQREHAGPNSGRPMGRRLDVLGRQIGFDRQELQSDWLAC